MNVNADIVTAHYSLVLQWAPEGVPQWRVSFRSKPTFGVEATGRSPIPDELVEVLSSLPGAPVWMIPMIQAIHAEVTQRATGG